MKQKIVKILTLIYFFVLANFMPAQAQPVTENDLDFLVYKIKKTYAGYKDKTNDNEFDKLIKEVKESSSKDTFANLSKLTMYFNDAHLRLFEKIPSEKIDTLECKNNLQKVKKILSKSKESRYNGFWINTKNDIVIYLNESSKGNFESYVMESIYNVPNGFCNIKIKKNKSNELVTDYLDIALLRRFFLKFNFKNDTVLMGNAYSKWTKISMYHEKYLNDKVPFSYIPTFTIIDSNTVVLKLPSFSKDQVKINDSIIIPN